MTLKNINKRFEVVSYSKRHDLYCKKEPGVYLNQKYLCSIERNSFGQYSIIGQKNFFHDLDTLEKGVYDYVESLPYNSEFYNPNYRKGVFEQMVVSDYLRSLGHKNGVILLKNVYGFDQKIYLTTDVSDLDKQEITIRLRGDDIHRGWTEVKVERDSDKIISGIDGLLKPYLLGNIAMQMAVVQKMTTVPINVNKIETEDLFPVEVHYKQQLIQELETMLDTLKKNDV